uniref:Uncharacterized protein n=1 Tax=Glossina pallidipes TaxID=7398 RepID=A0A1A9Z606_GLOPL
MYNSPKYMIASLIDCSLCFNDFYGDRNAFAVDNAEDDCPKLTVVQHQLVSSCGCGRIVCGCRRVLANVSQCNNISSYNNNLRKRATICLTVTKITQQSNPLSTKRIGMKSAIDERKTASRDLTIL